MFFSFQFLPKNTISPPKQSETEHHDVIIMAS